MTNRLIDQQVDLAGLVLRYADGGMNTYPTEWAATLIRVVPRESELSSLRDEGFLFIGENLCRKWSFVRQLGPTWGES